MQCYDLHYHQYILSLISMKHPLLNVHIHIKMKVCVCVCVWRGFIFKESFPLNKLNMYINVFAESICEVICLFPF